MLKQVSFVVEEDVYRVFKKILKKRNKKLKRVLRHFMVMTILDYLERGR